MSDEELEEANNIQELVRSRDLESVKLGIGLFLEIFGKYYISSSKQCWDIENQLKNKRGYVLLYDIMYMLQCILSRKTLYYE